VHVVVPPPECRATWNRLAPRLVGGTERVFFSGLMTLFSTLDTTLRPFMDFLSLSPCRSGRFVSVLLVFRIRFASRVLYAAQCGIILYFVAVDCESRTRAAGRLTRRFPSERLSSQIPGTLHVCICIGKWGLDHLKDARETSRSGVG
jgi:hypothetical protein